MTHNLWRIFYLELVLLVLLVFVSSYFSKLLPSDHFEVLLEALLLSSLVPKKFITNQKITFGQIIEIFLWFTWTLIYLHNCPFHFELGDSMKRSRPYSKYKKWVWLHSCEQSRHKSVGPLKKGFQ